MSVTISLERIWEGIAVGGAGGFIAGLAIWFSQWLREKVTEREHKKRVYNWLYKRTEKYKGLTVGSPDDPRWRSTIEIACYTNLTPDKVRYTCSVHKKIRPKLEKDLWKPEEPWEEKWGIREFVH